LVELTIVSKRWMPHTVTLKYIIMVPTRIRFLPTSLLTALHCGPKIGFGYVRGCVGGVGGWAGG